MRKNDKRKSVLTEQQRSGLGQIEGNEIMRKLLALCLTVSLLFADAARAQSIDETIGYLNQYGAGAQTSSYGIYDGLEGTTAIADAVPFRFSAPTTLFYAYHRCHQPMRGGERRNSCDYGMEARFDMSLASTIQPGSTGVWVNCDGSCITVRDWLSRTTSQTLFEIPCNGETKCQRMARALEHLKSLTGNDPFAQ